VKTNSLKALIIESNRLINIEEHFIYNKYAVFSSKKMINIFRFSFYFLKNNFKEELKFIKNEHLKTLIKFLLSWSNTYKLSNKRVKSHNYIINYFKNELELYDFTYKKQKIIFKNIKNIYSFIEYMDKNHYSLIEVKINKNKFILEVFVFFYKEKFDITKIAKDYYGELLD